MNNQARRKLNALFVLLIAGIISVALLAVFFGAKHIRQPNAAVSKVARIDGTILPVPQKLQPFNLMATNDKTFDKDSLKGHWSLIFFGYTHCPMVCPTTLVELTKMYKQLQAILPVNQLPHVVLVSVDPERDSLKRLKYYVKSFNPEFLGARGDMGHLRALAKQMNVVFSKVSFQGGDSTHYHVSHSAEVMLINPDGRLAAFLSYPHEAKQMVRDYEVMIRS